MKFLSILVLTSILFTACQSPKGNDNSKSESTEKSAFSFEQASNRFQSIALLNSGDLRGMDIGSPMSQVTDMEEMLIMNDDFYRHYQIDLNEFEFFDLLYYNYDGKLDEIAIDVHMESDDEAYEVYSDFEKYFTSKFGNPLVDYNGHLLWNKSDGESVIAYNLKFVSSYPEDDKAILEKKIEIGIKLVE